MARASGTSWTLMPPLSSTSQRHRCAPTPFGEPGRPVSPGWHPDMEAHRLRIACCAPPVAGRVRIAFQVCHVASAIWQDVAIWQEMWHGKSGLHCQVMSEYLNKQEFSDVSFLVEGHQTWLCALRMVVYADPPSCVGQENDAIRCQVDGSTRIAWELSNFISPFVCSLQGAALCGPSAGCACIRSRSLVGVFGPLVVCQKSMAVGGLKFFPSEVLSPRHSSDTLLRLLPTSAAA